MVWCNPREMAKINPRNSPINPLRDPVKMIRRGENREATREVRRNFGGVMFGKEGGGTTERKDLSKKMEEGGGRSL